MLTRTLLTAIALCASLLLAQQMNLRRFQAMRHVAEIGHLQPNSKLSLSRNGILASATSDGDVVISGRDDTGKLWNAWLNIRGGIGGTDVWTGDFDRNGRDDLLIASFFPANGRCLDPETVTFLMIDPAGKPEPWSIENQIPRRGASPAILPLLIATGRTGQRSSQQVANTVIRRTSAKIAP